MRRWYVLLLSFVLTGCFNSEMSWKKLSNEVDSSSSASSASPPTILYVSPAGTDANDGLTPLTPKRSVQTAYDYAVTNALTNVEIHACAGSYSVVNFNVSYPVSI